MTLTAIITRKGEPRTFEQRGTNGLTRTCTAIEVELESGTNRFIAEAYDDVCNNIQQHALTGDAAICELAFSTREQQTREGRTFIAQRVVVTALRTFTKVF